MSDSKFFNTLVLNHPAGLFVLFFTEMWERFSYYGMRALLVMFLVSSIGMGGWNWTREEAMSLYGSYTALVYITPILGGYIADRMIGYRQAVVIGAFIMTLGHFSMAMEFHPAFMFFGIFLLIIGNGLFKPNMTSIVSEMYRDVPHKKDAAYTIFYMGVNAGAFLGILLCGYLGEKVSWSAGFGLAGIFMLMGACQFWLAKDIFGDIGLKPSPAAADHIVKKSDSTHPTNSFTTLDRVLMVIAAFIGGLYAISEPFAQVYHLHLFTFAGFDLTNYFLFIGLAAFLFLLISRISRYDLVLKHRMYAIVFFALFTIIFWMCFEQAGGSMTIFAKDYTQRIMSGKYATIYILINALVTIVPMLIISYVLMMLIRATYRSYLWSNVVLASSFIVIWGIVFWMLHRDLSAQSYTVMLPNGSTTTIFENQPLAIGDTISLLDIDQKGKFMFISNDKRNNINQKEINLKTKSEFIQATVNRINKNVIEIPATWFQILNSLFIISLAPLFSRWWDSPFNPPGAIKYALGLLFLGLGFGALAFGALDIPKGASSASVSMVWLVLAFLLHTMGELCVSPVALSYVSKLVPGRMIAMMFGVWYVAVAIGNKLAGVLGGQIDKITESYSLTTFFMIFTIAPILFGILALTMQPLIRRWMHGVK